MLPEMDQAIQHLHGLREHLLKTLEGLDAAALNWTPTAHGTNSLYVLATHSIGSEHGWIAETLAGYPKTRNRAAEFEARGADLAALRQHFAQVARETEAILSARTPEQLATTRPDERRGPVTERWIVLHVISHLSEHLGQMYLTRQLWEQANANK